MEIVLKKCDYQYIKPTIEKAIKEDTSFLLVDFETLLRLNTLTSFHLYDYDYKFNHRDRVNIGDGVYIVGGKDGMTNCVAVYCLKSNDFLYPFIYAGNVDVEKEWQEGKVECIRG